MSDAWKGGELLEKYPFGNATVEPTEVSSCAPGVTVTVCTFVTVKVAGGAQALEMPAEIGNSLLPLPPGSDPELELPEEFELPLSAGKDPKLALAGNFEVPPLAGNDPELAMAREFELSLPEAGDPEASGDPPKDP